MSKWLAISLLLVSIASIQIGASMAKKLFPLLGPEGVCFIRIIVASTLLVSAWRPWRYKPTSKQIKVIAAYGIALGIMNLTYYLALQRLPLGLTVALEFVGPLSVALYYSRKPLDFLWAALAILGIILVLPNSNTNDISFTGIALALTAGAAWAFYIVFGKRASSVAHSGVTTSIGMTIALITVAPISIPHLKIDLLTDPKVLAAAIGVGLLSSALPYSLEMIALKRLPSKNFGILLSLSPAVAALAGFFVLHESLTLQQSLAIAFIFMASLGSALFISREMPPPIEL